MLKIVIALCVLGCSVNGQRVAPGVPPQHYQQPPPPQYQQVHQQQVHQQQQMHQQQQIHQQQVAPGVSPHQYQQQQQVQYQQVPVQQQVHQQVPVQQVHQQIPVHQQVPVQQVPQGHGQHVPHVGHATHGQVLNAANIQNEKEHIQEHLHVPIDTSKMSEAELQFHYFKMHDSDNNNKLDGCELIKSLIHWHAEDKHKEHKPEEGESGGTGEKEGTTYTDDNLADVVDYVLNTMDFNKDGYVDYTEYRKSEEESAKENKQ